MRGNGTSKWGESGMNKVEIFRNNNGNIVMFAFVKCLFWPNTDAWCH